MRHSAQVFHNQGRNAPTDNSGPFLWDLIELQLFRDPRLKGIAKRPTDLQILVCHNYSDPPVTIRCLDYLGFKNYTELRPSGSRPWEHIFKLRAVLEHLTTSSGANFIMHLDAADVLVADDPANILDRFLREFDCDALFNAEKFSWPNSVMKPGVSNARFLREQPPTVQRDLLDFYAGYDLSHEHLARLEAIEEFERRQASSSNCHLNSGCYIGRREFLIALLREVLSTATASASWQFEKDDQYLLREAYTRHWPNMQVDYANRIFQCMFCTAPMDVRSAYPLEGPAAYPWRALRSLRKVSNSTRAALHKALCRQ